MSSSLEFVIILAFLILSGVTVISVDLALKVCAENEQLKIMLNKERKND